MKNLFVVAVLMTFAACGSADQKAAESKKDAPLTQSKNSPEFNAAFSTLLDNYYHLKDGLVLSNDTIASTYAALLINNADSLQLNGIMADTAIIETAKGYIQTISAEAKGLMGEKNIEEKRKSFQMISDNLYDLVRTVRYDREKIYHQFCPMAFNDQGAFWLSQTSDIKNPYFGKKMLTCGEVKDTLNFQ
ncbi:MAG: DUF3347 domain-containing protein [Chitinophagaceae bacterium]|nr:DUF3347 domain-containing protein [Chitinophagaceae bacterium]